MIYDEKERESIINEAVERALLSLPDVIGHIIVSKTKQLNVSKKFYEANPKFAEHKDIVFQVAERLDDQYPGMDYEELIKKAVPEIEAQIKTLTGSDVKKSERPNRRLKNLTDLGNGEL